MKRSFLAAGTLLVPIIMFANPTDVKPHYDISPRMWKYMHVDSLPVKNHKNIKSYTEITPVYEEDFEYGTGTTATYNYNKSGLLTGGSFEYGDARGGHSFTIELNQYGHPAKVIWTEIAPCQDCSDEHEANHTVVTEYVPLYQTPGRMQQIRATTVKAGGKKVNSVNKFLVTPGPTGAPAKLICLEDNNIKMTFDSAGYPETYNIYTLEAGYPSSNWVLTTIGPEDSTFIGEVVDESHGEETIEYDSHGNWIKKSWKETYPDGEQIETGLLRTISYY